MSHTLIKIWATIETELLLDVKGNWDLNPEGARRCAEEQKSLV